MAAVAERIRRSSSRIRGSRRSRGQGRRRSSPTMPAPPLRPRPPGGRRAGVPSISPRCRPGSRPRGASRTRAAAATPSTTRGSALTWLANALSGQGITLRRGGGRHHRHHHGAAAGRAGGRGAGGVGGPRRADGAGRVAVGTHGDCNPRSLKRRADLALSRRGRPSNAGGARAKVLPMLLRLALCAVLVFGAGRRGVPRGRWNRCRNPDQGSPACRGFRPRSSGATRCCPAIRRRPSGRTRRRLTTPLGPGPFPVVVWNHGSAEVASRPRMRARPTPWRPTTSSHAATPWRRH